MHHIRNGRAGAATPWFILCGPLMIVLSVWVSYVTVQRHRQLQLQVAADATVLAAAAGLADDLLLTDRPDCFETVEGRARDCGHFLAKSNRVHNVPLELQPNPDNDPDGELVIGTLQHPKHDAFDVTPGELLRLTSESDAEEGKGGLGFWPCRNAVHLALRRGGVAASATAIVDRDVIGFRIQGAWSLPGQHEPAIPLAPVAIDVTDWEKAICEREGGDEHRMRSDGLPEPCKEGDGIPELAVELGGNGLLCDVGRPVADVRAEQPLARLVRQFRTGVTAEDLAGPRQGKLMLDDGLSDPEGRKNLLKLARLGAPDDELAEELRSNLRAMIGQPRVWMVYYRSSDNEVHVAGFVAARVMKAPQGKDRDLTVVLQPCQLITCTAVTDHSRRDLGPRTLYNPYVGKVRLVE